MNTKGVAEAIRARLAGFSALAGNVEYIGFDKPQDAEPEALGPFPYKGICLISAHPWDTKTSDGGNELFQVTTFCRPTATASAYSQALELSQAAYDALHKFDLSVSGSNVVNLLWDSSPGMMTDPDGVTVYRPMDFMVVYDDGT